MLVAIDIGNTNITIGIFDQNTLIGKLPPDYQSSSYE